MADRTDIAQIDPDLELTFGPCTLECAGTLNVRTRRHVLEAVKIVLRGEPLTIDIDVSGLRIADHDGANALAELETMAAEAGVRLRWRGLDAHPATDGLAV